MNPSLVPIGLFCVLLFRAAQTEFVLGPQGGSCYDACLAKGLNCNPVIQTNNSPNLFKTVGVTCTPNPKNWWSEDMPAYVSDPSDPYYATIGQCLGYMNVPASVNCAGSSLTTQRVCHCVSPSSGSKTAAFGSGYSGGIATPQERTMFSHVIHPLASHGVMTHFWATDGDAFLDQVKIRYYVDGEKNPSIAFFPALACGVGFNDDLNPWGTQWFGKGAKDGAWFNNFRIPFGHSIRVTVQSMNSTGGGFYIILRGVPELAINIGGILIPPQARLQLQVLDQDIQPIEWVPIADVPSGSGLFFMHSLAVTSGNLNFLEGCYHQYSPYHQEFPGTVLSTGTEDYFDSAWYFNGGQFRLPVSGFTHQSTDSKGRIRWSAYRFHEMDPLPFDSGFKLVWRNGDVLDPNGLKCFAQTGNIVGNPTVSHVTVYAWVYVWK